MDIAEAMPCTKLLPHHDKWLGIVNKELESLVPGP